MYSSGVAQRACLCLCAAQQWSLVRPTEPPLPVLSLTCTCLCACASVPVSLSCPLQVNAAGNVLLDTFVSQKEAVTDFRTWVSGVTPQHLIGAPGIEEVQKQVGIRVCGLWSVCF